jgi:hypothetical protein
MLGDRGTFQPAYCIIVELGDLHTLHLEVYASLSPYILSHVQSLRASTSLCIFIKESVLLLGFCSEDKGLVMKDRCSQLSMCGYQACVSWQLSCSCSKMMQRIHLQLQIFVSQGAVVTSPNKG